jgi:hypothetical protein
MLRKMRLTLQERLNIIDEVSFAGYHTALVGTSHFLRRLQNATNFNTGKLPCVFLVILPTWNYRQRRVYKQVDGIYWEQSLNCLVELKGTHRYKNCPVLQRPKMRNEGLSEADRKILNSRVIDGNNVKMQDRRIPASLHSIMPNDAASISMCSDRISRNTLPAITFRKVPLSSNRSTLG